MAVQVNQKGTCSVKSQVKSRPVCLRDVKWCHQHADGACVHGMLDCKQRSIFAPAVVSNSVQKGAWLSSYREDE